LSDTGSVVGLGDFQRFVEAAGPVDSQCFVEVAGLVGLAVAIEHLHLELVEQYWFLQPPQKMLEAILD
jgi:hypothetical protein